MGDQKPESGGGGDAGDVTPLSVSAYFDETHKKYLGLVQGDEETSSKEVQTMITETIKKLEDLTRQVSVLGILSDNENYKEMSPSELKFILLPFMIGNLWQLTRSQERKHICNVSKVYFRDYLKRCFNYEIVSKLPPEAEPEEDEEEERSSSSNKAKAGRAPPPPKNPDEVRAMKIQRFKEAKMLDEKIGPLLSSHLDGEDFDDEELSIFIVSLLKRNALDAEDQLRSIAQEMELIKYAEKMKKAGGGNKPSSSSSASGPSSSSDPRHNRNHQKENEGPRKPPEIFILTQDQVQKKVFGAGYPAIPVMTVEELYEQRRRTGQWGPPGGHSANMPPPTETDDDREAQEEALVEQDDAELLARQRRMDEYKDEHRAGWGNRYNRS